MGNNQFVFIGISKQQLYCYENNTLVASYVISSAKKGLGEQMGSECTPRGWHQVHALIGLQAAVNSVFVARQLTGEVYDQALAALFPNRDWIITRIIQLDGLEELRNKNGQVDTLKRYIYIHGTPDSTDMSKPGSHGCIRMQNNDIVTFANWVSRNTAVCIE